MNAARFLTLTGLALASGATSPSQAAAQGVVVGQQVRVTAPSLDLRKATGEVTAADAAALTVRGARAEWTVPRTALTRLEAADGTRGHWVKGLLIGAGAGLVVGLVATDGFDTGAGGQCSGSGDIYADLCLAGIAAITVGSAAVGAVIGALVRTTRWVDVPLEPLPSLMPDAARRLSLSAGAAGAGDASGAPVP